MGWFLIATGLVVLIPVIQQVRAGQQTMRDVAGFIVFVAGLVLAGVGQQFFSGADRDRLLYAGVAVVLIGLVLARIAWRRSESPR
jgi:hypothetical protein